jgi:hypothetical protein
MINKNDDIHIPSLCLLSPWINIPSLNPSYSKNEKFDYLNSRFIANSKDQYLGSKLYELSVYHSKEILGLELIDIFKANNIKVVIFDMDQCIVNMHSRGLLKRKNIDLFLKKIKKDFIIFSTILFEHDIKLAIGTHSDEIEYNALKTEKNYIIGKELVEILLSKTVPDIQNQFKIIAYNPMQHSNKSSLNTYKKLHIRKISEFYNVSTSECLLFDDDQGNIDNTDGIFNAYKVNVNEGFELNSYLINQILQKGFVGPVNYESNNETRDTDLDSDIAGYPDTQIFERTDNQIHGCTDTQISGYTDSRVLKSRKFWDDKGVNDIEHVFPHLMTDKQLSLFPSTLIFGGGNEIFIDDIQNFSDRLLYNQKKNSDNFEKFDYNDYNDNTHDNANSDSNRNVNDIKNHSDDNRKGKSELMIAINDIHVYPIFWRHPLHRAFTPLGLEWLFYAIFPSRKKCNDDHHNGKVIDDNMNNNDIYNKYKSEKYDNKNDITGSTELVISQKIVHSKSANDAIIKIAKFIIENSKKSK